MSARVVFGCFVWHCQGRLSVIEVRVLTVRIILLITAMLTGNDES
jgi:hypothetical protein